MTATSIVERELDDAIQNFFREQNLMKHDITPNRLYTATLTLITLLALAETVAAQARHIRSAPVGNSVGGFSSFHSSPAPVLHQNPDPSRFASVRQGFDGGRPEPAGGRYPDRPYRNWYCSYCYGHHHTHDFYPYGYEIPSSLSYTGFPSDYQDEQAVAAAPPEDYGPPCGAEDELEGQVQQLSDEVAELRAGEAYPPGLGYGPGYGAPAPAPADPETQLPTVLVYRDGHQMEIQNYAVYGQTVWVLDQITRKVAVADLDVAKTKQLNDQRGVEFDISESR
jgi:hypothetical protein